MNMWFSYILLIVLSLKRRENVLFFLKWPFLSFSKSHIHLKDTIIRRIILFHSFYSSKKYSIISTSSSVIPKKKKKNHGNYQDISQPLKHHHKKSATVPLFFPYSRKSVPIIQRFKLHCSTHKTTVFDLAYTTVPRSVLYCFPLTFLIELLLFLCQVSSSGQ